MAAEEGGASLSSLQSAAAEAGVAATRGASSSSSSASCARTGAGEGRLTGTDELEGGAVFELVVGLDAEVCLLPKAAKNDGVEGTAEGKVESEGLGMQARGYVPGDGASCDV